MIENIWEHKWSSSNLLLKEAESFVNDNIIKSILKEQLKEFIEQKNEDKFLEWESNVTLTDEKLKEKIIRKLKIANINDIIKMSKEEKEEVLKEIIQIDGVNVLRISKITGILYHFIRYLE